MVWVFTLSISFLILMTGILVATYAYVIFNSKHINSKLSVANISTEISNFQEKIDTATKTNNELSIQNNQLLETIDQLYGLMTGSNFALDKSHTKDEISKLKKLIQNQFNLLESQKNNLNLLNEDLSELNAKVSKEHTISDK